VQGAVDDGAVGDVAVRVQRPVPKVKLYVGVLLGLRACGAALAQDEQGRYRLEAGEIPDAEYAEIRERWLRPRLQAVRELLRTL
jgi:hypothetical protein